jgi:hypothetical protein
MQINAWGKEIRDISNATVEMQYGDHLSVAYKSSHTGLFHVFNINAELLGFLVTHEGSDAAMLVGPFGGVEYVEPSK